MSPGALVLLGIMIGVGMLGSGILAVELYARRPRRHRFEGNYRDARSPFRIVAPPSVDAERSDERIDRHVARLGRLRARRWADDAS